MLGANLPGQTGGGNQFVTGEACYMFSARCTAEVTGLGATDIYIYIMVLERCAAAVTVAVAAGSI